MEYSDLLVERDNAVSAAVLAGLQLGEPKLIHDGKAVVIVPNGCEVKEFDRKYDPRLPDHVKAKFEAHDADSFIRYFDQFRSPHSQVLCDLKRAIFTAVLDYHAAPTEAAGPAPAWREHIAIFPCPRTVEWETWMGQNKREMSQAPFAQFIEDNLPDIAEPDGNVILEVAKTLQAKTNVNFASATRLDNGQTQFLYQETIEAKAGDRGTLNIPEKFVLGIRPFEGSEPYRMDARLRYRLKEGSLSFWYDLLRPHKIIEDALAGMLAKIEAETGVTVLRGMAA